MRAVVQMLLPSPQQRLDDLITRVAQLRGEVESHRVKRNYHTLRVNQIDPHKDWWTFAHHKQACHDAQVEVDALNARIAKHAIKLEDMLSSMGLPE